MEKAVACFQCMLEINLNSADLSTRLTPAEFFAAFELFFSSDLPKFGDKGGNYTLIFDTESNLRFISNVLFLCSDAISFVSWYAIHRLTKVTAPNCPQQAADPDTGNTYRKGYIIV